MSAIEKKLEKEKDNYDVPENVKIEFHSLFKFDFHFQQENATVERKIYKLIKEKL